MNEHLQLLADPAEEWTAAIFITEAGKNRPVTTLTGFTTQGAACLAAERYWKEHPVEPPLWIGAEVQSLRKP